MENSVVKIMDKDHKKIKELLNNLILNPGKNILESDFNRFKWSIEKHFFIEEKVIFNSEELIELHEELNNILNEHQEILRLVDIFEEELYENKIPDFKELKYKILNHAKYEDEIFYPRLDELLDEDKKSEIISRTKEIII